jgi:hypothetical protein
MSDDRTVILLGSDQPVPGTAGRVWRAVDGAPAYLRVLLAPSADDLDLSEFGPDVSVWIGVQVDSLTAAGDPADATGLLAVGQEAEPGFEGPFNAWLDDEHVPGLAAVDGTLSAHRYRATNGAEPEYFAVYHLRDLTVNKSPEWKRASQTPRSAEMKPHSRKRVRGLYEPA